MKFFYDNLIDYSNTAMQAASEDSEFPVENLASELIGESYKTGATDTNESIVIDFGEAKSVDAAIIYEHTLLNTDVVKIQGNATNEWSSPSVDETMTWASGPMVENFSSSKSYRFWKFEITKADTSSRSIGRVYLGPVLTVTSPSDKNYKIKRGDKSVISESQSGQIYSNVKGIYRTFTVGFDGIGEAEKETVEEMVDAVGLHTAIFYQIHETISPLDEIIYAHLTKIPEFSYQGISSEIEWSYDVELREVI
jgi:hypothetical protein